MKEIKFLALDIDGTILKKDYTFSEKVKDAIQKAVAKGVKVALVTGRMHCAAEPIAKQLGIEAPIFSYQGALVKENGKTLLEASMDDKLARAVVEDLKQFDVQVNLYMNDTLYSEKEDDRLTEYCDKRNLTYVIKSFDDIEEIAAHKLLAIGSTPEETTRVLEFLQEKYPDKLYVVKSMPIFCEITDKKVSKGLAIGKLLEHWGINKSNTIAIGDQDNDLEMLKAVKIGLAMGNATDSLKALSEIELPSVEDDGVAYAIEKFILNNDGE